MENTTYCDITLHNVLSLMSQLAFAKGQDSVFYGNPENNGDRTDYIKIKDYLEHSDCFTELTSSDIDFFIKSLKKTGK